jgi:hypothetical protein
MSSTNSRPSSYDGGSEASSKEAGSRLLWLRDTNVESGRESALHNDQAPIDLFDVALIISCYERSGPP